MCQIWCHSELVRRVATKKNPTTLHPNRYEPREGGDQEQRAEHREREQELIVAYSFSKRIRGIQSWVSNSRILQGAISLSLVLLTFSCLWCLLHPTVSQINSSAQHNTRLNGCFSAKLVHWISSAESDKPQEWTVGETFCMRKEGRRCKMGRGSKKSSFWQIDSAVWYNLTWNMWFHAVPNAVNYRQSPFSHPQVWMGSCLLSCARPTQLRDCLWLTSAHFSPRNYSRFWSACLLWDHEVSWGSSGVWQRRRAGALFSSNANTKWHNPDMKLHPT